MKGKHYDEYYADRLCPMASFGIKDVNVCYHTVNYLVM
jgi:hypothetical protein